MSYGSASPGLTPSARVSIEGEYSATLGDVGAQGWICEEGRPLGVIRARRALTW